MNIIESLRLQEKFKSMHKVYDRRTQMVPEFDNPEALEGFALLMDLLKIPNKLIDKLYVVERKPIHPVQSLLPKHLKHIMMYLLTSVDLFQEKAALALLLPRMKLNAIERRVVWAQLKYWAEDKQENKMGSRNAL